MIQAVKMERAPGDRWGEAMFAQGVFDVIDLVSWDDTCVFVLQSVITNTKYWVFPWLLVCRTEQVAADYVW